MVACWGYNANGQTTTPASLGVCSAIAAGGYHTVALKENGTVVAWGAGTTSQANGGSTNLEFGQCITPTILTSAAEISAGYGHTVALRVSATPCLGDVDGSGEVDSGDVAIVILDFGVCVGCPTDLDESTQVDSADVALVLLFSGTCP